MSIAETDIWRSAKLLIDQHGDEAPIHAAMRVDIMLEMGDLDGRRVWLRVLRTIEDLLAKEAPPGVSVH